MGLPNGVNHIAISTADMKSQITFFSDVLGAELKALYWMHGVDKTFHAFLKLSDTSYVAFQQADGNALIEPEIGRTHAGSPAGLSAPGTLQHLAFNVDSREDLLAMRDRIRSRGVQVLGPINHGFCQSIYFAGLELLSLEVTWAPEALDPQQWIDPEVVGLCDIDADELAAMTNPTPYESPGGTVPQPPVDASKPSLVGGMSGSMRMSDDDVWTKISYTDPPVPRASN
jgi:catechol 2,3-dioxygenase-like lactoylglutathione lyase family enzyme